MSDTRIGTTALVFDNETDIIFRVSIVSRHS
jgi:hypothetical protein